MTDAVQVFPPGYRVTDASGNVVSGAKIKMWEGGSSTPRPMYSNEGLSTSLGSVVYTRSDGFPVSEEDGDTTVIVYTGSGLYDIEITDADDVVIFPRKINQRGALDTSDFLTAADASSLSINVVSTAENLSLTESYNGKHVRGDTSSQSVTLTLDDAATLEDGWNVEISKAAAANTLRLVTTSSQVINFNGQSHTSLVLSQLGEGFAIRCDGAAFYVTAYTPPLRNAVGVIVIADRITSAPGGPTPGARYLVTAAFSTFEEHDIIEADASGGFIEYTPATDCGWLAYVQDEDEIYQFRGTAWVPLVTTGASQSEMEAASSAARVVTPSVQHFHPGMVKAWGVIDFSGGTPSLAAGYNISATVTDDGTGITSIAFSTNLSSANYAVIVTLRTTIVGGSTTALTAVVASQSTSGFTVRTSACTNSSDTRATLTDFNFSFIVLGDI